MHRITTRRLLPSIAVFLAVSLAAALPVSAHSRAQFPIQSSGDRGADVTALQHLLRYRGRSVIASGYFGTDTRSALVAYQQSAGLNGSGVANVATWERIVPQISQGASGEAVLALKKLLNAKHRSGLALTSSFDSATRTALRSFQSHVGLGATGVADRNTWRNLVWHFMRPDFRRSSLCNYNGGSTRADWGTAATIAHLESAADLFRQRASGVAAIGDISFEHGGDINLHQTHELGMDIDIALIRLDGRQCSNPGIGYGSSQYDRTDTRRLLQAIHDAFGPRLKLIYFNDPQMIKERLSVRYPHHDDHLHVRLCEPSHPQAKYAC